MPSSLGRVRFLRETDMRKSRFTDEMGYSVRSPEPLSGCLRRRTIGFQTCSGGNHGVCRARRVVEFSFSLYGGRSGSDHAGGHGLCQCSIHLLLLWSPGRIALFASVSKAGPISEWLTANLARLGLPAVSPDQVHGRRATR